MVIPKLLVPKRTWLTFSLARLFLVVAVVAYGCKWVLDRVHLCADQYDLVAGMSVSRGLAGPTGWEKTAADWLGINYELDVVFLEFASPASNNAFSSDMEVASRMPKLKKLVIQRQSISEDIIAAIKGMEGLERLTFRDTDMTKETAIGLKKALPNAHITVSKSTRQWDVTLIDLP